MIQNWQLTRVALIKVESQPFTFLATTKSGLPISIFVFYNPLSTHQPEASFKKLNQSCCSLKAPYMTVHCFKKNPDSLPCLTNPARLDSRLSPHRMDPNHVGPPPLPPHVQWFSAQGHCLAMSSAQALLGPLFSNSPFPSPFKQHLLTRFPTCCLAEGPRNLSANLYLYHTVLLSFLHNFFPFSEITSINLRAEAMPILQLMPRIMLLSEKKLPISLKDNENILGLNWE